MNDTQIENFRQALKVKFPSDKHDLLDLMDPEELVALKKMLSEYSKTGTSNTLTELKNLDWEQEPVDPETWLLDDYYTGGMGAALYPKLQKHFIEIFSRNDIVELILTGSIGWGKDYLATLMQSRMLYEISCLKQPQQFLGIAANTPIIFAILNVTSNKSTEYFENVKALIDESAYFQAQFARNTRRNFVLEFPKRVYFRDAGSTELGAIGSNIFGAVINELNFMQKSTTSVRKKSSETEYDLAKNLYSGISTRLKSRFIYSGKALGKVILISSRAEPDAFLERHAKARKNDPTVYVMDYRTWDVKDLSTFGSKWFFVETGDLTKNPRIIPPEEEPEYRKLWEKEQATITDVMQETIVKVPDVYKRDFEEDIYGNLRDVAGKPTIGLNTFIADTAKIAKAFNVIPNIEEEVQHLQSLEAVMKILPINKQTTNLADDFEIDKAKLLVHHRGAERCVHVDLAVKGGIGGDSAGFAIGCLDGYKILEKKTPEGAVIKETLPKVHIDFTLEIHANPTTKEIDFAAIRELIYTLSKMGLNITYVTFDSFNSVDIIQMLKSQGYKSEVFSLDKKPDGYIIYKNMILEERINIPYHFRAFKETRELERNMKNGKILHPPASRGGSKDVSDALAGVARGVFEKYKMGAETTMPASTEIITTPAAATKLQDKGFVMATDDLSVEETFTRSVLLG